MGYDRNMAIASTLKDKHNKDAYREGFSLLPVLNLGNYLAWKTYVPTKVLQQSRYCNHFNAPVLYLFFSVMAVLYLKHTHMHLHS